MRILRAAQQHVRCGGRAGETDREQSRHRAPVRPLHHRKGNLTAIGTLVERATGYTMLLHLPDGYKPEQVRDALAAKIKTLRTRCGVR